VQYSVAVATSATLSDLFPALTTRWIRYPLVLRQRYRKRFTLIIQVSQHYRKYSSPRRTLSAAASLLSRGYGSSLAMLYYTKLRKCMSVPVIYQVVNTQITVNHAEDGTIRAFPGMTANLNTKIKRIRE
jgi:hypothetical protein